MAVLPTCRVCAAQDLGLVAEAQAGVDHGAKQHAEAVAAAEELCGKQAEEIKALPCGVRTPGQELALERHRVASVYRRGGVLSSQVTGSFVLTYGCEAVISQYLNQSRLRLAGKTAPDAIELMKALAERWADDAYVPMQARMQRLAATAFAGTPGLSDPQEAAAQEGFFRWWHSHSVKPWRVHSAVHRLLVEVTGLPGVHAADSNTGNTLSASALRLHLGYPVGARGAALRKGRVGADKEVSIQRICDELNMLVPGLRCGRGKEQMTAGTAACALNAALHSVYGMTFQRVRHPDTGRPTESYVLAANKLFVGQPDVDGGTGVEQLQVSWGGS
jgi:hypothetical protein